MSEDVATYTPAAALETTALAKDRDAAARSFVSYAKVIGLITFVSRLLGMARESIAANYFGAGAVWSAFTVAFTIPNLFRKLFGEGALSAAFIPLYAQAVKLEQGSSEGSGFRVQGSGNANEGSGVRVQGSGNANEGLGARVQGSGNTKEDAASSSFLNPEPQTLNPSLPSSLNPEPRTLNPSVPSSLNPEPRTLNPTSPSSAEFAAASVNLLCAILIALTVVGEIILSALLWFDLRADYLLAVRLTMIMLPYVLLVCGTAFLGGILQVHHRFVATAATAIVLNLCLIIAIIGAARVFDLKTEAGQTAGAKWLSVAVLIAGGIQVAMLLPSLRSAGFRFKLILHLWTPAIRKMLRMTLPVALGAGVLQISVLFDKGISFLLAEGAGATHFMLLGFSIPYPMVEGAAARLNWAQFMYQFPLGVFAIALATAIFPRLSSDAIDIDKSQFKSVLRQGVEAALFIGLPASVGMIVVRYPAVRLLFERGNFTYEDTRWVALSTAIYSSAIWAFSLQQILNKAYYALHDTFTPLIWGIVNLALNLVIEIPLLWTPLREAAMPVGTLVSFGIQSVAMLWLLDRRLGGIELRQSMAAIAKMLLATAVMWIACIVVQYLPIYPAGEGKTTLAVQLFILMLTGGVTYFGAALLLGLRGELRTFRRRSPRS